MTALSSPASPLRLLLVEHDADVRDLLHTFLTSEGYDVSLVGSSEEACALLQEHTFHLVLTDLFKTNRTNPFSSIESLRDEAHPTPVAVMTGWNVEEAEIKQQGFAGLIRKPFDLDEVLSSIAASLPTPFRPEQARQAQMVQAYFAALNARDWEALATLCTDDVTHTLLPEDLPRAGTISGKSASLTYAEAALARVPGIQYEEVLVSRDRHGLAARSCSIWHEPAGSLQRLTSTLWFRFQGERICQISVQPGSSERFTRLLVQAPRPTPHTSVIPRHAACVLLVEADELMRASLAQRLTQAGYQVSSVSALAEALALLKERCFHLILADLFAGPSLHTQAEAHLLWRNASPTPVGLLTNQLIGPGEATSGNFAFLVSKPVDQEHLLWLMAAILQQPLTRAQERQTDLVRRLFAAINTEEWEQLTTLCTEELRFYPPPGSSFHHVKVLHGVQAYQAQLEAVKCRFPDYQLEEVLCYAHPKGVAVRYQASWVLPDGRTQAHTGATLFGFQSERIAQIAAWANTVTLLPLQIAAERSSA